jgi:hypothetical protein
MEESLSIARTTPPRPMARPASSCRRLLPAVLLLAGTLPALAQTRVLPAGSEQLPAQLRPYAGAWDIERIGAPRRCTVTLGAETVPHGRQLRFPATCRRALPILAEVTAWTVVDGAPRLLDAAGKVVIAFGEAAAPGRRGKGSDGAAYGLDPAGHVRAAPRREPSAAERAATAASRPTPVDPATAPDRDSLPGVYAMMRQRGREACRLRLTAEPRKAAGGALVQFEGPCTDTGLTIFDPVGWRYLDGRLALIARRGHAVELVFEDGGWRKDPAVGAPLMLRKLP